MGGRGVRKFPTQPKKKKNKKKLFIGPIIRIGREIQFLPYAGFFKFQLTSANRLGVTVFQIFWKNFLKVFVLLPP